MHFYSQAGCHFKVSRIKAVGSVEGSPPQKIVLFVWSRNGIIWSISDAYCE